MTGSSLQTSSWGKPGKELLIALPEDLGARVTEVLSRRRAMRVGLAAGVGTSVALSLPPFTRQARANPIWWAGAVVFAATITWLVNRVLDKAFPNDVNELGIKPITPRPSGDRFHDSFADPFAVTNRRYNFRDTYSRQYGYYIGLQACVRSDKDDPIPDYKDLATHEIKRIAKEEEYYKTLLFPCGKRSEPTARDARTFSDTCDDYRVDPARLDLDYVRPFNDGKEAHLGYGVSSKRTGQKDLLIAV